MLKINKTTNLSAQSLVEVSENESTVNKVVAYMNATISENNNVNINKSIQDTTLFNSNKTSVLADFSEFETYVYNMVTEE